MSPYVVISSTFIASLTPSAYTHLSKQDITQAQRAIAEYNAQPGSAKSNAGTVAQDVAAHNVIHPYSANTCGLYNAYARPSAQWWGVQVYVNDCFIYWSTNPGQLVAVGGATVLVGVACGATIACGILAVVVATYIQLISFALNHDTHSCGHRGAYINALWSGGVPWPSPVC